MAEENEKEIELRSLRTDLKNQRALFQKMQEKVETLTVENKRLKEKIIQSFTAEELADYLNQTIDSFNKKVSTPDANVKYIIHSMDVDLKAQVYNDTSGILKFSAPTQTGTTESLSSIKISIRAVPNT